jgi:hypothetical protein
MLEKLFSRHLEDAEVLYVAVHRHWLLGAIHLFFPACALLATWIFLYVLPFPTVALLVAFVDSGILIWMLRNFFDYYLDAWLITDQAVIDVEWHGWFHRQSTRIDYTSIEGVSYEIKGIPGTLFRFGTVTIEKIGSGSTVSIDNVKNPRDVESTILACQEECIRSKNLKDSSAVQEMIAEIVAERMYIREQEAERGEEELEEVR